MKIARRIALFHLLSAFTIVAMLAAACTPVDLSGASGGGGSDCAHEDGDGDNVFCTSLTGNSGSWSVPGDGYTITNFVIKAGNADYGAVAGCYDVSQSSTSVSWNRVGDGPDCKDISHVEIYYTRNDSPPPPPPPVNVQYCRATGNPYPYEVATAQLDSATNLPTGMGVSDIYPVPTGGCPTAPPPPPEVQYCRAMGNPYPYEPRTALLDTTTNLPTGMGANDIFPVPAGGCPTAPPPPPPPPQRISLCHATGSATNPYVQLTINYTGLHGHEDHAGDIIPAPADGCPTPPPPQQISLCHATGSETNPYVQLTINYTGLHGHEGHAGDIIPAPAGGCPTPPPPQRISLCHATGSATNSYVQLTISYTGLHGHEGHAGDIIPAPVGGCPTPPPEVQFCQATGDPYPYVVANAQLNPSNSKPVGFNPAKDIYPVPLGGCPTPPPPPPPPPQQISLCHATGSATNPYVQLTISYTGLHGHEDHTGDILPMPAGGCPVPPPPPPPEYLTYCKATGNPYPYVRVTSLKDSTTGLPVGYNGSVDFYPVPDDGCPQPVQVALCHATGNPYPYVEMVVTVNPGTGLTGHEGHADDIIPMPDDGCPQEPPPPTVNICHATGDPYPYILMTVPYDVVTNTHGHEGHADDLIPAPETGCPTDDEPPVIPPAPPPVANCPQFIIFHTFRDENLEIYRLDGVEGGTDFELINLTNSDAVDCRPSRSPDDAWLVYQSDRNDNVELYYTDLGGTAQFRLTMSNSNNINPMFGPDNETVAFQSDRNGSWDIFTTDIDTHAERQLTSGTFDEVNPFYSPDLRWLAFQSNRNANWDLYILDTQTGNEYSLVATGADEIYPAWSPNGQQIAFLRDDDGVWNLYVIDFSGENLIQITNGDGDTTNATWSPEGNRIAYQSERSGNLDIYSYEMSTGSEYRLTDYAGADSGPTWDCGGANIAFTSTRDGNPNILQVAWQGGAQSNLTIDPATDKWSQWSPSKEPASRGR